MKNIAKVLHSLCCLTQNYRLEYCVLAGKDWCGICHWKGSTVILTAPVESYDERLKRSAEMKTATFAARRSFSRRRSTCTSGHRHRHGHGLTAILEQNPTIMWTALTARIRCSRNSENLPEHKERIRTICGDFFKYELEPESYDGAVSMMALHYYSREENLELFHRVCRSIKRAGSFC